MRVPELDYRATMPAAIHRASERFGDHEFVVMPDRRMTFRQADEASRLVAKHLLAAGAGKGTRIGLMYPYGADWIVGWMAITRIGAIFMPFSTSYKPAELRKSVKYGDVEILLVPARMVGDDHVAFVEEAFPELASAGAEPLRIVGVPYLRQVMVQGATDRPWARPLSLDFRDQTDDTDIGDELFDAIEAEVSPADLMLTVFTSGTTSEPKGVVHTHGNFIRHGYNLGVFQGVSTETRWFCAMPFFWIGGVGLALNLSLAHGCTLICIEKFETDAALDLMEKEQATVLGVWSQLGQKIRQHIVATKRDVSNIPALAPPPPGTPTTSDPELRHNSLGMTETVGPHSAPGPEAARVLPEDMRGSFGPLVPYVEHRIADPETNETVPPGEEGEVCIRGYSLMNGLYKRERHEVFDDNGWYHTGDKGYIRDGYLYFNGRLSEMIKTSGSNVAPREVELTLETFPEVGLAVVLGMPDPDRGETVAAVLVPAANATIDVDDLVQRADKELSSYKVPRKVLVVPEQEMPYLASGKPDKLKLRVMLAERGVAVTRK